MHLLLKNEAAIKKAIKAVHAAPGEDAIVQS